MQLDLVRELIDIKGLANCTRDSFTQNPIHPSFGWVKHIGWVEISLDGGGGLVNIMKREKRSLKIIYMVSYALKWVSHVYVVYVRAQNVSQLVCVNTS